MHLEIDRKAPLQTYKERSGLQAVLCHPLLYDNRELPLHCRALLGGKNYSCPFLCRLSASESLRQQQVHVCAYFIEPLHGTSNHTIYIQ